VFLALAIFAAASLSYACGNDEETSGGATPTPAASGATTVSGDITVFAAASLTDAFTEMGSTFSAANADASVSFNFGGSQDLRTQLEQGASADVFASADTKQMDMAVAAGVAAEDPSPFAGNRLVVIVANGSEAGVGTLQDLAKPGVKLVLANADVPVGNYSRQFLDKASADPAFDPSYKDSVLANLVSEESNVRQVATKVQLGEADAGIAYSSDVTAELSQDVTKIDIPDALNQLATYPITLTAEPENEDVARAFVDFVLSDEGQAILESHGFIRAP
jgi:molybdate transport system substrate-binding protein